MKLRPRQIKLCSARFTQLESIRAGIKPKLSVSQSPCLTSLLSAASGVPSGIVEGTHLGPGLLREQTQARSISPSSARVWSQDFLPGWGAPYEGICFWDSKIEAPGSVFAQKLSTSIFIPFPEAEETQFMLIAVYQTSWFLTPWIFLPSKAPTTCENEQMANCSALFASHTWLYFVAH